MCANKKSEVGFLQIHESIHILNSVQTNCNQEQCDNLTCTDTHHLYFHSWTFFNEFIVYNITSINPVKMLCKIIGNTFSK